jgi:dihydroflavonol-4-reductase
MADKGTVLVTGGSGYIAGFVIAQLLAEGWRVRATVRSLSREAEVRGTLAKIAPAATGDALSFHAADLMSDAGWAEAVAAVDYVQHIASPIPTTKPKSDDELVVPAREGALRALRFARDAGVKRVVMTSSTAAITYGVAPGRSGPFTEADWTDPTHPDTSPYVRSKTIAERAARDFMAKEGGALEFVTVNPGAVLGPVLGRDFSASIEIVKKLMEGAFPACPRLGFPLVDVRDIADLHVRAMTAPDLNGERFLGAGDFYWMTDIAAVLKQGLGEQARKVPTGTLPDWLVRIIALLDPVTGSVTFELGRARPVSNAHASTRLGWVQRPAAESILDCARSLMVERIV